MRWIALILGMVAGCNLPTQKSVHDDLEQIKAEAISEIYSKLKKTCTSTTTAHRIEVEAELCAGLLDETIGKIDGLIQACGITEDRSDAH